MNFLNHPFFQICTVLCALLCLWVVACFLAVLADWLRQHSRALHARMKAAAEAAEKEIGTLKVDRDAYKLQRNDLTRELDGARYTIRILEQERDEARAYAEKDRKDITASLNAQITAIKAERDRAEKKLAAMRVLLLPGQL